MPLRSADVVLATRAGRALIRRGNTLLFYDVDSRTEQALPITTERFPDLLLTPPFAFVSPALVNLDTAALVGVSRARPLALSSEGQLLLPEVEADGSRLARGAASLADAELVSGASMIYSAASHGLARRSGVSRPRSPTDQSEGLRAICRVRAPSTAVSTRPRIR